MTHSMNPDTPTGRVHINQATGQPARWVGGGDPGTAAFYQTRGWQTTIGPDASIRTGSSRMLKWDDLTPAEQNTYKRQYPVV